MRCKELMCEVHVDVRSDDEGLVWQVWVQGLNQGPKEAIRVFVQLSGGGSAFGLAVGVAVTLWLRTMFENPSAEVPCSPPFLDL